MVVAAVSVEEAASIYCHNKSTMICLKNTTNIPCVIHGVTFVGRNACSRPSHCSCIQIFDNPNPSLPREASRPQLPIATECINCICLCCHMSILEAIDDFYTQGNWVSRLKWDYARNVSHQGVHDSIWRPVTCAHQSIGISEKLSVSLRPTHCDSRIVCMVDWIPHVVLTNCLTLITCASEFFPRCNVIDIKALTLSSQ